MRDKDYASYAPDKHGPEAERRKTESAAFIDALRHKHGLTVAELYPVVPERNRYRSFVRATEGDA